MKLCIQVEQLTPQGTKTKRDVVVIAAEVTHSDLNDHDLAGLMFGMEFAINNRISEIIGKQTRVHFMQGEVKI